MAGDAAAEGGALAVGGALDVRGGAVRPVVGDADLGVEAPLRAVGAVVQAEDAAIAQGEGGRRVGDGEGGAGELDDARALRDQVGDGRVFARLMQAQRPLPRDDGGAAGGGRGQLQGAHADLGERPLAGEQGERLVDPVVDRVGQRPREGGGLGQAQDGRVACDGAFHRQGVRHEPIAPRQGQRVPGVGHREGAEPPGGAVLRPQGGVLRGRYGEGRLRGVQGLPCLRRDGAALGVPPLGLRPRGLARKGGGEGAAQRGGQPVDAVGVAHLVALGNAREGQAALGGAERRHDGRRVQEVLAARERHRAGDGAGHGGRGAPVGRQGGALLEGYVARDDAAAGERAGLGDGHALLAQRERHGGEGREGLPHPRLMGPEEGLLGGKVLCVEGVPCLAVGADLERPTAGVAAVAVGHRQAVAVEGEGLALAGVEGERAALELRLPGFVLGGLPEPFGPGVAVDERVVGGACVGLAPGGLDGGALPGDGLAAEEELELSDGDALVVAPADDGRGGGQAHIAGRHRGRGQGQRAGDGGRRGLQAADAEGDVRALQRKRPLGGPDRERATRVVASRKASVPPSAPAVSVAAIPAACGRSQNSGDTALWPASAQPAPAQSASPAMVAASGASKALRSQ